MAILDLAVLKITAMVPTGIKPNGISFSSLESSLPSATNIVIKLPETKDSDDGDMKHSSA